MSAVLQSTLHGELAREASLATAREYLERVAETALGGIDRRNATWSKHWYLAAVAALCGNEQESLQWFEKAVDAGWRHYRRDEWDPAFASVRGHLRFQAQIDRMQGLVEEMHGRAAANGWHSAAPDSD